MTDDELYRQYLAGDTSAFGTLILKYTGRLVLYLTGLTHNIQDAEDLTIETFAAILTKRHFQHPASRFRTDISTCS